MQLIKIIVLLFFYSCLFSQTVVDTVISSHSNFNPSTQGVRFDTYFLSPNVYRQRKKGELSLVEMQLNYPSISYEMVPYQNTERISPVELFQMKVGEQSYAFGEPFVLYWITAEDIKNGIELVILNSELSWGIDTSKIYVLLKLSTFKSKWYKLSELKSKKLRRLAHKIEEIEIEARNNINNRLRMYFFVR